MENCQRHKKNARYFYNIKFSIEAVLCIRFCSPVSTTSDLLPFVSQTR